MIVQRYPLATFFVLAYALTWSLILLSSTSLLFALLGLFGPAAAAIIVTAVTEGGAGVRALLGRLLLWRVGLRWYLVALGLPFLLGLVALGIYSWLVGPVEQQPSQVMLTAILAVLVVGEELGWRGYALPRLQSRYNILVSSLILGVLWACWHLINILIPGLAHYGTAFPAFLLFVVSQTILFTWLANNTRGSVLIAWLFHAAINVSGSVLFVGDTALQWWLSGALYGIVALIVVLVLGPNIKRRSASPAQAQQAPV
jgi:membrane protease YdiL (CAAX protease family)